MKPRHRQCKSLVRRARRKDRTVGDEAEEAHGTSSAGRKLTVNDAAAQAGGAYAR